MSFSRDEPNPLRPYAVPASYQPVGSGPSGASKSRVNASKPPSGARTSYGSAGRDILSDIDYSNYLPDASPSVTEMIKNLVDQGVWKYTSVLLAQPFEVAKIVLQVQDANAIVNGGRNKEKKSRRQASHGPASSYNVRSGAFSYPSF
jgi:mitochondrial fusion and transport protein UGO1